MAPKKTPVSIALDALNKEAAKNRDAEHQYWHTWNEGGRQPEHLEPLLKAYTPFITQKANEYGRNAAMLSPEAVRAEVEKQVINAFHTYDPSRGAQLLTHVYQRVPKALRFVVTNQNIAHIPERPAFAIGKVMRGNAELEESLGRPPNEQELANHLGMSVRALKRVQSSQMKDVPSSAFEANPTTFANQRQKEILSMLPSVLTPEEHKVFELIYHPTAPVLSTGELAKRLNMTDSQISRLKTSIINKAKEYE